MKRGGVLERYQARVKKPLQEGVIARLEHNPNGPGSL
jgi:hypothetical protein